MKDIKYRAKIKNPTRLHRAIWLYGYVSRNKEGKWFMDTLNEDYIEVEEKSICEYTGIIDKNNKEIYGSDILKITCKFELRTGVEIDEVVWWKNGAWCCNDWCLFELISNQKDGEQEFEVIGNTHDNPELL